MDAVVVGEAGEEDAPEAPLAEVAVEAGGRGVVVLKEGGVGIDVGAEALAQDELGLGEMERGVKLGAGRALDAVIGPECLDAVAQLNLLKGLAGAVAGGEGGVALGVPVLREEDVVKEWRDSMDDGNDSVALGHGQRAARAEVVLDVNSEEDVVGGGVHITLYCGPKPSVANGVGGERRA